MKILNRVAVYLNKHLRSIPLKREIIITVIIFFFCRKGNCKRMTLGLSCEVGRRQRTFHILSGSVLSVWSKVESVLAGQSGANSKIQIVRCRKSDGSRIVGKSK